MRKLFTILVLSLFVSAFGQKKISKNELFEKYKNSISLKTIVNFENKKNLEDDFNFYYCLITKEKYDYKNDARFMSEDEFLKKFGNTEIETIAKNDYIYYLNVIAPYQKRWEFADNNKKCIKNPNEWKW